MKNELVKAVEARCEKALAAKAPVGEVKALHARWVDLCWADGEPPRIDLAVRVHDYIDANGGRA